MNKAGKFSALMQFILQLGKKKQERIPRCYVIKVLG
jgi:hypothetical protein